MGARELPEKLLVLVVTKTLEREGGVFGPETSRQDSLWDVFRGPLALKIVQGL